MIPLINSFSFGVRKVITMPVDNCIVNSFSIGVLNRRYPKGDKVLIRSMSIGYIDNVDFQEPKITRVK